MNALAWLRTLVVVLAEIVDRRARDWWCRFFEWITQPQRRGLLVLAIAVIMAGGTAWAITSYENGVAKRATEKANKLVRAQGTAGLIIIRNAALAECRRANQLQLDLRAVTTGENLFGNALDQFLATAAKARLATAHDPKTTPAQRQANLDAVSVYNGLRATIPLGLDVPEVPPRCQDVVPTIAELRAQAPPVAPASP